MSTMRGAPRRQLARHDTSHDAVFDAGVLGYHDPQDLITARKGIDHRAVSAKNLIK